MYKYAIIVAAGSGSRFGGTLPKQFQLIQSRPVLWHTIKAFTEAYKDIEIILVLPQEHLAIGGEIAEEFPKFKIKLTAGGETRFQSVKNGLKYVQKDSIVFIHDGVRCLVSCELIRRCAETALEKGNAIPAIAASDTIRIETGSAYKLVDRNKVKLIQTPQTFTSAVIKSAFEQDYDESFTDEAAVAEKAGIKIHLVEGEETNIKITRPIDLVIAEKLLSHS